MLHDHLTILKDLDATTVKPRPIKEFLHLFNQIERTVLLNIFELEGVDGERYETLFSVANGGVGAIFTPHDGQTPPTQYRRPVLELLQSAEGPARTLMNHYNKSCKPEHLPKAESSSQATSLPKWKRSIPSEKTLRDGLNGVYKVLRPLTWRGDRLFSNGL